MPAQHLVQRSQPVKQDLRVAQRDHVIASPHLRDPLDLLDPLEDPVIPVL